jgi:hypothetical protein
VQGAAARVAELRRGAQPVEHGGEPGERGAVAVPRGGGGLERGVHEPEQREHPVALGALHRPLEVQDHPVAERAARVVVERVDEERVAEPPRAEEVLVELGAAHRVPRHHAPPVRHLHPLPRDAGGGPVQPGVVLQVGALVAGRVRRVGLHAGGRREDQVRGAGREEGTEPPPAGVAPLVHPAVIRRREQGAEDGFEPGQVCGRERSAHGLLEVRMVTGRRSRHLR